MTRLHDRPDRVAPLLPAFVAAWIFFSFPVLAGTPESAYYHMATDRLFWFVQISDLHTGTAGTTDTANLSWFLNQAVPVITPSFVVATGDLVDATDGGLVPQDQSLSEWTAYHDMITGAGMTDDLYFDIPGNHDHYNDRDFVFYRAHSLQGAASGGTQFSWQRELVIDGIPHTYHFMAVNTAGNDGAPFTLSPPYGDNAGLDARELAFIEAELQANAHADLTVVFGHHPLPQRPTGNSRDTYIQYGVSEFIQMMETYGVSLYAYGHTHQYRQGLLPTPNSPGVMDINIDALGKDAPCFYQLYAIDCNGIASAAQPVNAWPAVLITAPMDIMIGADANPYAYSVNDLNPKPIRALVFDASPVTEVRFRIDDGAWQSMIRVDGPLWQGLWDEPSILDTTRQLEVQATGSATRSDTIHVGVPDTAAAGTSSGGSKGGCFISSL